MSGFNHAARQPNVTSPPRYFGGALLSQHRTDAMIVSYVRYERGRCPPHSHLRPFLAFVTAGGYREHWGSGELDLGPAGVASHPGGVTHADEILVPETRVLVVEAQSDFGASLDDREAGVRSGDRSAPFTLGPAAAGRLAVLLAETRGDRPVEPLAAESMAAEAFAEAYIPRRDRGPSWVRRVTELLSDTFDRPLTLREVAGEVGVHPVYLSRAYRAATGIGLAEARRRARVRRAIAALTQGNEPVEVALESGFSDQSHMTRAVRSMSGLTPSRWRAVGRM